MHKWQLHEAKNKLSHIIEVAIKGEPQCITRRGEEAVMIISVADYKKMQKPKMSFNRFLIEGTRIDDLEIERVQGKAREIEL
jgi:antitoxin Phd